MLSWKLTSGTTGRTIFFPRREEAKPLAPGERERERERERQRDLLACLIAGAALLRGRVRSLNARDQTDQTASKREQREERESKRVVPQRPETSFEPPLPDVQGGNSRKFSRIALES